MSVRWIVVVALALLLLVLVVQNAEVVTIRLLLWEVRMSQVILIAVSAISGFVVGWFVARMTERKRRKAA